MAVFRSVIVSSSHSHPRGKVKLRVDAEIAFRSAFDDAIKVLACWKLSSAGLLQCELWMDRPCFGHARPYSSLSADDVHTYEPKTALLRRRNSSSPNTPQLSRDWRYMQYFE